MQDEDDLSAKDQAESKGSWLQGQDEDCRRKKGFSCQKGKRKSKINSLSKLTHQAARNCGLLFSGLRQPSFIFLALWVKENL